MRVQDDGYIQLADGVIELTGIYMSVVSSSLFIPGPEE
jgi:hypothetical protein